MKGLFSRNQKRPFHWTLTTEYHFFKYVTCVSRNAKLPQRYATTSFQERALIPSVSIGLLPIWRRPAQAIMILLYGAGGEPGRGEIPMIQMSRLFLSDFPWAFARQGVLRTNIARPVRKWAGQVHSHTAMAMNTTKGECTKCRTAKRLLYAIKKAELCGTKWLTPAISKIAFIPIPTTPNGMLTSTETLEPMKAQKKTTAREQCCA